jgi:hypothetical protein
MIRDVYSGSFASRIRISDSGVKKALDPGSDPQNCFHSHYNESLLPIAFWKQLRRTTVRFLLTNVFFNWGETLLHTAIHLSQIYNEGIRITRMVECGRNVGVQR